MIHIVYINDQFGTGDKVKWKIAIYIYFIT